MAVVAVAFAAAVAFALVDLHCCDQLKAAVACVAAASLAVALSVDGILAVADVAAPSPWRRHSAVAAVVYTAAAADYRCYTKPVRYRQLFD